MRYHWIQAKKQRYYTVQVVQDLFDAWVVIQRWGSLVSRQKGQQHVLCASREEAEAKVAAIARRRRYRHYQYGA